jgi:hypothetical protein
MAFKVALIAHAPDGDPARHRCVIDTGRYWLVAVVVRNQAQALEQAQKLVAEQGIHSLMLCPGFTHKDVAEIAAAVGPQVGVTVARGDGPSGRATMEIMRREGWFV